MKICIAQIKPVKGDIEKNIISHKKFIDLAVAKHAELIVFPELSITGYEPHLAEELGIQKEDKRFEDFQTISDINNITIAMGAPVRIASGICISLLIFQPNTARLLYSKKYLHPDEESFFVSGENFPCLKVNNIKISFAICYELSIAEHSEKAYKYGAEIYIASVAKSLPGIEKAEQCLSAIANKYTIPSLRVWAKVPCGTIRVQ